MDYFISVLGRLLGDTGWLDTAFVVSAGVAMFALVLGVLFLLSGVVDPVRARLRRFAGDPRAQKERRKDLGDRLEPVAPYILPGNEKERSTVRKNLIYAGYRNANAVTVYYGIKTLLAVALPVVAAPLLVGMQDVERTHLLMALVFLSGLGLLLPNVFLARKTAKRQRRLRNGLPDALDLLVVCTEAGLGLKAAIQRVAGEIGVSHPELAEELAIVNAETRAGVDREQALTNLSERTGLEEIRGLVSLLVQSMRFGTSIADALRVYAEDFRDKRMQRAEEEAAKIGTKMIFPLVLCFFPAFFVVSIGPGILGVLRYFSG